MKVLVTGATGFVGSRVVDLLLDGDQHEVIGLARNQERAKLLTAKGAEALVADLRSVDIIAEAAAKADAVVRNLDHLMLQGPKSKVLCVLPWHHAAPIYTRSSNFHSVYSTSIRLLGLSSIQVVCHARTII